jgi:hypothetical protein
MLFNRYSRYIRMWVFECHIGGLCHTERQV